MSGEHSNGSVASASIARSYANHSRIGWLLTIGGSALWTYGYLAGGSPPLINWTAFSPQWISDYLPNWQSELGSALAIFGSAPIYYAQAKSG